MSPATIHDVARDAGVSTATVSRALNESPRVSEQTAVRVRRSAVKLGYHVNPIARALRKNSTGNVGLLVPSVSNPFFTMLVDEIEKQMVTIGLNLYLCTSRDDVEIEAARLESLANGAVDGILISPCNALRSSTALVNAQRKLPIVQIDRSARGVDIDWIGLDDMHAMELIIAHLKDCGITSVTLVTSDARNSSGGLRRAAARAACRTYGVTLSNVLEGDFSDTWGGQVARRLLKQGDLPEAIVCTDDQIATGIVRELQAHGVQIPHDVMVTGLDDVPHASLLTPGLTTIRQPVASIAEDAVRVLGGLMSDGGHPDRPIVRTAMRGQLLVRGSTHVGPNSLEHPSGVRDEPESRVLAAHWQREERVATGKG